MRIIALFLLTLPVLACADRDVTPTAIDPAFAKPPSGGGDTHSRVNLVWADANEGAPAGIRGDGRNRFGHFDAPANEYQGDFCGVRGLLFDGKGETGGIDFDPDSYYDTATMQASCGAERDMQVFLGTATSIGSTATIATPHVKTGGLWSMAPGEIRLNAMIVGMQGLACRLEFDARYAGSSDVVATRLPDGTDESGATVRRWNVASQGSHTAACLDEHPRNNGRFIDTGIRYYLPFSVTVTQVRNPAPVFP